MSENATFPYKAALSEGNAKTNRITKNGVLPATSLIFESAGVLLEGTFFPVSILKRSSFSEIGHCDEFFHAEIRFLFYITE